MLSQSACTIRIRTTGRGVADLTERIVRWVESTGLELGVLTVFLRHTSASLLIQENADPQVLRDLEAFLARLVPDGDPLFAHIEEGPDDMPAHVRAALTQPSLSIPLVAGRLVLGTWQAIYLFEHRRQAHDREIVLHLLGQ